MADNMQEIGVRATVQNMGGYTSALNTLAQKTDATSEKLKSATSQTSAFDKAFGSAANSIKSAIPQIGQTEEALGGMAEAVGVSGAAFAALAIPIGVAAAALGGFIALATRGAGFSEIENGFARITASVNVSADALLGKLHTATDGTISDMQLLTEVNQTLIGVSKDFGQQFGQALPDLMKIAKVTAEATRRDTVQVFDQITEAIRHGQTRMLMTSGIIIDQKAAFETYAKSIHVSVNAMTEAEREQALLNAVLQQGKGIVDALGQSQESNADKMQAASVTITNIFDKISAAVQPVFSVILDVINNVLNTIADAVNQIAPYLLLIGQFVANGLRFVLNAVKPVFDAIASVVGSMLGIPKGLNLSVKQFFDGAAAVIGALAGGILSAANQYVFPAILTIAQGIADFLIGLSPPPKGPLHQIDIGGENLMKSWIGGIAGVSLDPVSQVAANVAQVMGGIANENLDQVKTRLAQLDAAVKPFQDQLDIVKADFDAINNVAKPAIDAIDRQIALAQNALAQGSQAAADQIKTLDAQKLRLQDYVDTQQIAVDNAEIQLGLAKMQSAQERAALTIREQELNATQKAAAVTGAKAPKEPKGKGGRGAVQETPALGGLAGGGAGVPDFSITGKAEAAGADLAQSFGVGFASAAGPQGLATAQGFIGQIGAQVSRIGSTDIGAKITDGIQKGLIEPIKVKIAQIGDFFLDTFSAEKPDSIPNKIKNGMAAWGAIITNAGAIFDQIIVAPIEAKVAIIKGFFDPSNPESIPARLSNFVNKVIPNAVVDLPKILENSVSKQWQTMIDTISAGLGHFFNDTTGDGTLQGIINKAIAWIGTIPDQVSKLFQDLGTAIVTRFVNPIIDALNTVISAFESFVNDHILPIIRAIASTASALAAATGHPEEAKAFEILGKVQSVGFGRIPHAAEGGIFGRGLLQVGEKGFEGAQKIGVFPHEFMTALNSLNSTLARPSAGVQSMSTYNSSSSVSNMNNTFNGVGGANDVIRRLATMQAFK